MRKILFALLLLTVLIAACDGQMPVQTVSKAAAHDYGSPPPGVSLLYVGDPQHAGWYVGFDWSGTPRATIKLAPPPDESSFLFQSPDGSAFQLTPGGGKGGFTFGTEYLDRLGKRLSDQDLNQRFHDTMWADTSSRLCTLDFNSQQWNIGLMAAGGTPTVHTVAIDSFVVQSGVIAIRVAACSPQHDRALLAYNYPQYPTFYWVVTLSDGKIQSRHAFGRNELADVVASPDGRLVAESSNKSAGYLLRGAAPMTTIRRTVDGSVVASLDPRYGVLAFSADGSAVLVNTSPFVSGMATHLALVKVASGAVLWRYDGPEEYGGRWLQPGGGDIAVMLQSPFDTALHATVDVVIVHADGTSTTIPGQFIRP